MIQKILFLSLLMLFFVSLSAQKKNEETAYDPHDYFVENFHPPSGNMFRSASGKPGPAYWQNKADYRIEVTLNEQDTSLKGRVIITYTNNSPDELGYLWLQLDQNIFHPQSRGAATTLYPGDYFGVLGNEKGGFQINEVSIIQDKNNYRVKPLINDTRMQVELKSPMKPGGDKIVITVVYNYTIPAEGAGRFGRMQTNSSTIYQIAQWYPRMCVYDDIEGWNTLPYLGGGEFYCNFGDFEYFITAPSDMVIYGSGDLENPAEVLSGEQIRRLDQAAESDETVSIINIYEAKKRIRNMSLKSKTWHFSMKNTRDVAWVAGRGLIWDAARVNLPSGRKVLAMSCYPPESAGDTAWSRSTEYLKASMEFYSAHFFEYPWNHAINSAGITAGMEYPGMIFNRYTLTRSRLWFLVTHEIGHNWYPMIVGNNERKYMWLDEGLNTYVNYLANENFNNGEYATDPVILHTSFFASMDYEDFMNHKDPLMAVSDAMDTKQHYQYYGKTAYGLFLLRNIVVGKELFDKAFKEFTVNWAFKHPMPFDFFHAINNGTGENLNWFWKGWFFTTGKLDQAITSVTYAEDDPAKGAVIKLENKGKLIMPVILKIVQTDGQENTIHLPVEIWQRSGVWTYHYPSAIPLEKVILDPDKVMPDMDRNNNEWKK